MNFLELIKAGNINEAYKLLSTKREDVIKNYNEFNNDRKIRETQVGKREDDITGDKIEVVAKIAMPFQRQIVKTASSFLFGSPVKLVERNSSEDTEIDKEAYQTILNLWDDLRLDPMLLKFCKAVKSETEATIIFYPVKKEGDTETKIKARLLTNENGKVYPVFDAFGDMIAFGWEYATKENDKEIAYLYVWTAETTYAYRKESKEWAKGVQSPNLFKKIPVVYLSQAHPEWWEVQEMIDRYENSFSRLCDTNDYFAHPTLMGTGKIKSLPEKNKSRKVIGLDIVKEGDKIIESKLSYLTWDQAPESVRLELETLKSLIYGLSDTPDLSFDNVKGIGNISGIALKFMFLSAILKAKEAEGDYQIAISRIINILKAGVSNITNTGLSQSMEDLRIDIKFTNVLPENLKEIIEILSEATGGKAVMSQKTAITHNPLIEDNDDELSKIEEEYNKDAISNLAESVLP